MEQAGTVKEYPANPIYGIILLFLLALIVVVTVAMSSIQRDIKSKVRESLQTVLAATQEAHHIWIQHRLSELDSMRLVPDLDELIEDIAMGEHPTHLHQHGDHHLLELSLRLILDKYRDGAYWMIDPLGIVLAASNSEDVGLAHHAFAENLDMLPHGKSMFIPHLVGTDLDRADQTMYFIGPLYNEHQERLAYLLVEVDPTVHFNEITRLGRMGSSGETYAFDADGVLISDSRFNDQLHLAGVLKPGQSAINRIRIADPGGNILQGHQPSVPNSEQPLTLMAASATIGQSGFNLEGYRDYRGVPVVGAWVWLEDYQFGLTTEIDHAEAYNSYYTTRTIVLVCIASIIVLSLGLCTLLLLRQKHIKRLMRENQLALKVMVRERTQELEEAKLNLQNAYRELEKVAVTDGLTGIANRRQADTKLREEWRRAQRTAYPLTIMMIDVDCFKQYNDHYGHQAGDECLRQVAKALEDSDICRRPGDLLARYGGEEFIVMLSNCETEHAAQAAGNLLDAVRELAIPHAFNCTPHRDIVTVSIGAAVIQEPGLELESLIELADKALYRSKDEGRDRASFSHF